MVKRTKVTCDACGEIIPNPHPWGGDHQVQYHVPATVLESGGRTTRINPEHVTADACADCILTVHMFLTSSRRPKDDGLPHLHVPTGDKGLKLVKKEKPND